MKTMKAKKVLYAASILALVQACAIPTGPSHEAILTHRPFWASQQQAVSRVTQKTPSHSARIDDAAIRLGDDSPEWLVQIYSQMDTG